MRAGRAGPEGGLDPLLHLLLLSPTFMAMTFAVFVVYGVVAHAFRRRVIDSPGVQRWLRYREPTVREVAGRAPPGP